jgi:rSAM/selenodomain-associated transferase 2
LADGAEAQARIDVVIPALNAADTLPACLAALAPARARGLLGRAIVVDGGSVDATASLAAEHGAVVVTSPSGRGRQLAAGAARADAPWLLFLHADTRLEADWAEAAAAFLDRPDADRVAGAFTLAFDVAGPGARRVARLANWRTRALGLPYGDQGLLISSALYDVAGGFRDIPLMEDVAFVQQLGRERIALLPARAVTSAARFERDGWWWRPLRNLGTLALYFAGVPPAVLKRLYG